MNKKYYYIYLIVIILISGCLPGQVRETGLKETVASKLWYGKFKEALDTQLSAANPPDPCLDVCDDETTAIAVKEPSSQTEQLPLERRRPRHGNTERENLSICTRRAQVAKSRNIKRLVVSFEGLGTYSERFTSHFYRYYDGLWSGKMPRRISGMGSYVGRDLISPNLHQDYKDTDFLLFSERNGANTVEGCVETYRKIMGPKLKLSLVGLSYGAGEALILAERLSKKKMYGRHGIIVTNLLTVDLRGTERLFGNGPRRKMNGNFRTPTNVVRHMNFGRFNALEPLFLSPKFGYPGYRSRSSGVKGSITVNHPMPTAAGHTTQLKTDVIQKYYQEMF